MKNFIFFPMLFFLFSCNSKEKSSDQPKVAEMKNSINDAVGAVEEETFTVYNAEAIKKIWEEELKVKNLSVELKEFKIVAGRTIGSAAENYYILTAETIDHSVKTAALLTLRDGKFYFEQRPGPDDQPVYLVIICSGTCLNGCDPVVSLQNSKRYLQCSACTDCQKSETEIR